MIITWTPKDVLDDDGNDVGELFEGTVEVEIKPKLERLKLAQSLQVKVENSEVDIADDSIGKVEKADAILRDCVKSVNLKAQGQPVTSIDELECYEQGVHISNALLGMCLGGMKLGKPSKPKSNKRAG